MILKAKRWVSLETLIQLTSRQSLMKLPKELLQVVDQHRLPLPMEGRRSPEPHRWLQQHWPWKQPEKGQKTMLKAARSQILLARAVGLLVLMFEPVPLGLQRLVLLQDLGSIEEGHGEHAGLQVRLHNVTLWGQKSWAYLDEMDIQTKPDIIGDVEMHLK